MNLLNLFICNLSIVDFVYDKVVYQLYKSLDLPCLSDVQPLLEFSLT